MNSNYRHMRTGMFLAALLIAAGPMGAAQAEIPRDPTAAKNAEYDCPVPGVREKLLASASALGRKTHDLNSLGCAADLLFHAATSGPKDAAVLESAAQAHITYLQQVAIEKDADFIGVRNEEWKARLGKGGSQLSQLVKMLREQEASNPNAVVLVARAEPLLYRYEMPKTYVDAVRRSMASLEKALAADAGLAGGGGQAALGRMYFELPPMYGGSLDKSAQHLLKAVGIDGNKLLWRRYLAEVYEESGEQAKLNTELEFLANYAIRDGDDLQELADQWHQAIGLASRSGAGPVQKQLEAKRAAILREHPELKNRVRTAIGGHGGEDPLSGEKQY